jgi:hypothetical protein
MLAASPAHGPSATIVAVMHPRPGSAPAAAVELRARAAGPIEITLRSAGQHAVLKIDLAGRRVTLNRT